MSLLPDVSNNEAMRILMKAQAQGVEALTAPEAEIFRRVAELAIPQVAENPPTEDEYALASEFVSDETLAKLRSIFEQ